MEDPALRLLENNRFFKIALENIRNHPHYNDVSSTHCAIVVKGGSIISIAVNKHLRNSFIDVHRHHDSCNLHSECRAILKARRKTNLRGAKIYVARLKKQNKAPGLSRPCPMCISVMKNYGIKRVIFSTELGFDSVSLNQL